MTTGALPHPLTTTSHHQQRSTATYTHYRPPTPANDHPQPPATNDHHQAARPDCQRPRTTLTTHPPAPAAAHYRQPPTNSYTQRPSATTAPSTTQLATPALGQATRLLQHLRTSCPSIPSISTPHSSDLDDITSTPSSTKSISPIQPATLSPEAFESYNLDPLNLTTRLSRPCPYFNTLTASPT